MEIVSNNEKENEKPVMVSIRCTAYNHEKYIRECLEGFVMQRTNFKFEAIVHDDASTDGTASIILEYAEKYPDIIKPIIQTENQFSKHDGSLTRILNAATRGKYTAFCEGDDYWTDPLKLQKQFDYLESHEDCVMVHTKARVYKQSEKVFEKGTIGQAHIDFEHCLINNPICTLTTFFRTSIHDQYLKEIQTQPNWRMGDYPRWLYMLATNKVYFLDEVTAVYRVLENSASHSKDINTSLRYTDNIAEIACFFAYKYGRQHLIKAITERCIRAKIEIFVKNEARPNKQSCITIPESSLSIKTKILWHMSQYELTRHILKTFWY